MKMEDLNKICEISEITGKELTEKHVDLL